MANNTNWISFKLGAERKLGLPNKHAHLFSFDSIYFILFSFDLKNGDMVAIFVFCPHDNTVLAYILKIVQDRGLVTIIHI